MDKGTRESELMIITCRELAENLGIEYLQASCVIKMLLSVGVAEEAERVKCTGRGRPTVKYRVPDKITINLKKGTVEVSDA